MYSHSSSSHDLNSNTKKENISPSPVDNGGVYIPFHILHELSSPLLALIYSQLISLSYKEGWCWATTQYIATKLSINPRTLEDNLKILEERKFIYRNTWSSPKGKIRHIIPKSNAYLYWEKWMCKHPVPDFITEKYVKEFLTLNKKDSFVKAVNFMGKRKTNVVKNIPSSNYKTSNPKPNHEIRGSMHATTKSVGPSNNTKVLLDREANSESKAPPSFEMSLEEELKKSNLDSELGLKYYRYFKDTFTKNPVGGVIHALKEGYAEEKVKVEEEARKQTALKFELEKDKERRTELNRQICEKIENVKKKGYLSKYSVYVSDYICEIKHDHWKGTMRFEYSNPDTKGRLLKLINTMNIEL